MTASKIVDTGLLADTPAAGKSRDMGSLLSSLVAANNDHATKIDANTAAIAALVSGGSPTIAAEIAGLPAITVAAQAATHRDATIQLKDGAGLALAAPALARIWISDAAAGAPTAAAPAGGVSIVTNGISEVVETANKVLDVISGATGLITVRLTDATGSINTTWYVNVAIGNQIVSAAVTITNA